MRSSLEHVLRRVADPVIAVSGGVDSVTLAAVATLMRPDVSIMHAISPAVPAEATARVQELAAQRGWSLTLVRAGEFEDSRYRSNPVNRCFYCKTNLYAAIRARSAGQILSGANTDDLAEYRPGLDAAREHGVRHPYIEARIDKQSVRQIARDLGLDAIARLPASPCLASRVETGIRIEPSTLAFIHGVENLVARRLAPKTVRCRVRAKSISIEMDRQCLSALDERDRRLLELHISAFPNRPANLPISFEEYRRGSAFLTDGIHP